MRHNNLVGILFAFCISLKQLKRPVFRKSVFFDPLFYRKSVLLKD